MVFKLARIWTDPEKWDSVGGLRFEQHAEPHIEHEASEDSAGLGSLRAWT